MERRKRPDHCWRGAQCKDMSRPRRALELSRASAIELLSCDRESIQPRLSSGSVNDMSTKLKIGLVAVASAALLGATAANAAQYANVVSATPVTNSVAVPRQDCVQSERLVQQPTSGAGALVGAIAGGVIGNQFGHGFGKRRRHRRRRRRRRGDRQQHRSEREPASIRPGAALPHRQRLREPGRRLRRHLRIPRPALFDAPSERPGPAPGDRRAPHDRQRTARPSRPARELRRRPARDPCAGRAELQRSAAGVLRRRTGLLRRVTRLLRARAGLLLGALLPRRTTSRRRRSASASATGSAARGISGYRYGWHGHHWLALRHDDVT